MIMDTNGTPSPLDLRLGARLKAVRLDRALTLDQLAGRAGVSPAMISRIERAESSPTAALLIRLSAGLDVTPSFLFSEERHAGPIARQADQPVWRDPESGYVRRAVSPPGTGSAIDIVDVTTPPGARILLDRPASGRPLDQQIWVFEGSLELTLDGIVHRLGAGDCMHMLIDGPIIFHNPGPEPVRYAVVVTLRDGPAPGRQP